MGAASDHDDDQRLVGDWLRGLSRRTGLPLQLDDDGVCAVGFGHELDCAIEVPGDGSVYLRSPLLPWRPDASSALAQRCLQLQFLGSSTDGAAFGLDPDQRELVLWKACPLALLDDVRFSLAVSGFMKTAARLRDELQGSPGAGNRARPLGLPGSTMPAGFLQRA